MPSTAFARHPRCPTANCPSCKSPLCPSNSSPAWPPAAPKTWGSLTPVAVAKGGPVLGMPSSWICHSVSKLVKFMTYDLCTLILQIPDLMSLSLLMFIKYVLEFAFCKRKGSTFYQPTITGIFWTGVQHIKYQDSLFEVSIDSHLEVV